MDQMFISWLNPAVTSVLHQRPIELCKLLWFYSLKKQWFPISLTRKSNLGVKSELSEDKNSYIWQAKRCQSTSDRSPVLMFWNGIRLQQITSNRECLYKQQPCVRLSYLNYLAYTSSGLAVDCFTACPKMSTLMVANSTQTSKKCSPTL